MKNRKKIATSLSTQDPELLKLIQFQNQGYFPMFCFSGSSTESQGYMVGYGDSYPLR